MKIVMFCGGSAVGKTAVLKALIPQFLDKNFLPCACKLDCIQSSDEETYKEMGIPCVTGLSGDVCPDHFLVSNLPELWSWAESMNRSPLFIETAGLCHRCSPATQKIISICVVDSTASCRNPEQLGPMLTQADAVVLTKIDMVSQAEREIISYYIAKTNPTAIIFPVDGLAGYGAEPLGTWIMNQPDIETYEEDQLRHCMPSAVCSYCIGECRVGSSYQQGVVGKIDFEEVG